MRVTAADEAAIEEAARLDDRSPSDWIRWTAVAAAHKRIEREQKKAAKRGG